MEKPIITYHVLNTDDTYTRQDSVYAGTYTGDEDLSITFRIWNNFRGTEDVEDLHNFNLVCRFLTEEDNALLKYISLSVTDTIEIPCVVENNALIGSFVDPVILSGHANTGSEEYVSNYISITISFNPGAGAYLKDHDLKSLIVDVVEL
jgi:hypothetical protein